MPGFTINKKINSNRLWLVALAMLWLASLPEAAAQVLTLDSRECVKVEAGVNEIIPYHRYEFKTFSNDILPITSEEQRAYHRSLADTPATHLVDKLVFFFIWRENEILRITARKETKVDYINRLDHNITLSAASLSGSNSAIIFNKLIQFQKKANCIMIDPDIGLYNYLCIPLITSGFSDKIEYYRILHFAGYKIVPTTKLLDNYFATINPAFNYGYYWHAGFTEEEEEKIVANKPEPIDWLTKLKRYFKNLFSENIISYKKSSIWFVRIAQIYENTLSIFANNETSTPLPFLTNQQLENWPRYFHFPFNREAQKQFTPLYGRNNIKGYYFYDEKLHPETKGYVVVPGKFFLPRRLQIVSVNDVPWQE